MLVLEGHEVLGLFYNPNIYPADEYELRLNAARTIAQQMRFPLDDIPYDPSEWLNKTNSLQHEPEGGKRCAECFRIRLKKTYLYMIDHDCDVFATTLTVSPHKSPEVVNNIGWEIGDNRFMARDFKKKDGFKKAIQLAKNYDIYRQNYCGCVYSMRQKGG